MDKQRIHTSMLQDTEVGIMDFRETIIYPEKVEDAKDEAVQEVAPTVTPSPKVNPQVEVEEEEVSKEEVEAKTENVQENVPLEEHQISGEVQEPGETNLISPPKAEVKEAAPALQEEKNASLEEVANSKEAAEVEVAAEQEGTGEKEEQKEGEQSETRITDVIDPSQDGGEERVKSANETLKQAEQDHLESSSKKKAKAGSAGISKLSSNEKEKDPVGEKLKKTEDAVVEQKTEKEAEVNANQVDAVAGITAPEAKKEDAQKTLKDSMDASLPKTIEDVDEFKKRGKASKIGDQVKKTIEGKTKEIEGTFEQLDKTEKPADPKQAVPLDEIEKALPTNNLNIGSGLMPPVQDATLDLKSYVDESDNLLKKEGIKQEHLDMVDSGDLFEAKTLKDDVEKKSSEEPNAIRKEEKGLHKETETQLAQEEKSQKEQMEKQRASGLGGARKDQEDTKTDFEKKREEVTNHINGIYETTNKAVQDKLDNLKKNSLAAFDREEAAASSAFEANVKYRMDKFKEKRYDGLFGTAKQIKDFFMGIDEMPEVKEIFESEKTTFINRIDAAIAKIINDSQKVIDECKALIAQARKDIEKYVSTLSPDLKKIGEDAQKDIQKKLDELDAKVNKAAEDLKKELEKKRAEAIKKIDEKIEKMKEEMSGMLSKIGNLLLDAAIKFFKWALEAAGYSADELMGIINKGKAVITAIVKDPIQFMGNLAKAVGSGLKNFGANIMTHLKEGFITWMTGQMNSLPIQVPDKLDVKGVFSVALQVLGLTWGSLRGKLSKKVGEDKVAMAEKSVEIVTEVKEKGPIAMYDQLKDQAENVKTQVIEGAKEWAITSIIKSGLIKVASMLNPAGAIVQAILAIYNGVMFFVNNWQQIVDFVNSVFDSIASIASGAIGAAAGFIEKTLAKTIPLILDFLARFLGLSGIANKIQKVIEKVRKPIDKAVDKVINFIEGKMKKLWGKVSGKDKKKDEAKKIKDKNKGEKPDELKQEDKDDHKKIGSAIKGKLDDPANKKQSFDDYYQKKKALAESLENQYQPQLKKGINLEIELESFEKAKKDGDITIKISIKPNDYLISFDIKNEDDEKRFVQLLQGAFKSLGSHAMGDVSKEKILKEQKASKVTDTPVSNEALAKEKEDKKKKKEEEKEEELKKSAAKIHEKIAMVQARFGKACRGKYHPQNTFSVNGVDFFVETDDNFYIMPETAVPKYRYKVKGYFPEHILEKEADSQEELSKKKSETGKLENTLFSLRKQPPTDDLNKRIKAMEDALEIASAKPLSGEAKDHADRAEKLRTMVGQVKAGGPEQEIDAIKYFQENQGTPQFKIFKTYADGSVTIWVDRAISNQFAYHHYKIPIEKAKENYESFPSCIVNDGPSTVFLASLVAEPSRHSAAAITNSLLLNAKSELKADTEPQKRVEQDKTITTPEKDNVLHHTSMTHKGSDPTAAVSGDYPKDPRLQSQNANVNVTNRDLASVKQNPQLLNKLKAEFEKNKDKSDSEVSAIFEKEIKDYLDL